MLNKLNVVNGSMTPSFSPKVLDYEVEVDDAISLVLEYEAENDAPVTIYGNDNLTEGENHVLIEVFDEKVTTYTLLVNKKVHMPVAKFENTYEKVEVPVRSEFLNDLVTPGISVICFITIAVLFSIIFHSNK